MKYRLLIVLMLLLSSCASTPTDSATTTPPNGNKLRHENNEYVANIILFSEEFARLPAEPQKKLFSESTQAIAMNNNILMHRIKLATMLSLPDSQVKDSGKAQSLLQDLIQSNGLTSLDLAYIKLLQQFNNAQIRQQQKMKEDTKTTETLYLKYMTLLAKYDVQQKKYEALEQKLIDLKNIEKSLSGREVKSIEKNKP